MKLEEFSEIVREQPGAMASMLFKEPDDDWEPAAFLLRADDSLMVIGIDPHYLRNHLTKDLLFEERLPEVIRKERAQHLAVLTSAWTVKMDDPDLTPEKAQEIIAWCGEHGVGNHPLATEALMMNIHSVEGHEFWTADILRHDDAPPTLGQWEASPDGATHTGRAIDAIEEAMKEVRDA
jgi:hypothetical protein